ncbi:hypothetical protein D9M73_173120 [compost metagenome]
MGPEFGEEAEQYEQQERRQEWVAIQRAAFRKLAQARLADERHHDQLVDQGGDHQQCSAQQEIIEHRRQATGQAHRWKVALGAQQVFGHGGAVLRAVKTPILRNCRHKKAPAVASRGFFVGDESAFGLNFVSLHAFLALHSNESHFLTLFQALEAVTLNSAEMHEQIRTAFWSDKTKTFLVVKPLDGTALTLRHSLISLELRIRDSFFQLKEYWAGLQESKRRRTGCSKSQRYCPGHEP